MSFTPVKKGVGTVLESKNGNKIGVLCDEHPANRALVSMAWLNRPFSLGPKERCTRQEDSRSDDEKQTLHIATPFAGSA